MKNFLPALFLILFAFNVHAQQISSKSNFTGAPRSGAVSFVINDTAYVGLGIGDALYKDFYKYNSINDTWTKIADFPGDKRTNATAFTLFGKGYVGLGKGDYPHDTNYRDFYEFDPLHNQWNKVADFPGTARASVASFVIGDQAYVGTGADTSGQLGDFYKFNSQTWTKIAGLDTSQNRMSAVGFSINGKGYVTGGSRVKNSKTSIYSDVLEYDPIANAWNTKVSANVNLSVTGAAVFVQNNIAYICYGDLKYSVVTYDPADGSISNLGDLLSVDTRSAPVAFTIGSKSYFGMGGAYDSDNDINVYYVDLKLIDFNITGVSKSSLPESIKIYPNPCSDKIFLEGSQFSERIEKVEILSASNGAVLKKGQTAGDHTSMYLDLNGLNSGMYLLEISTAENVYFKKLIKE